MCIQLHFQIGNMWCMVSIFSPLDLILVLVLWPHLLYRQSCCQVFTSGTMLKSLPQLVLLILTQQQYLLKAVYFLSSELILADGREHVLYFYFLIQYAT